jgi:site-specific DNA-adenine methylase
MSALKIEGFDILKQFLGNYSLFKCGGDLLPDLVEFYRWLHNTLSNLITEEEAKEMSISEVADRFSSYYSDQSAVTLYIKVRGKYNSHVHVEEYPPPLQYSNSGLICIILPLHCMQ